MPKSSEKCLSIDDIKKLRDKYNLCGEFSDYGFMHELFRGLDCIIDNLEQSAIDCRRLSKKLDDHNINY